MESPKRSERWIAGTSILMGLPLLSGCASFSSMPEPVLTTQVALGMVAEYPVAEALRRYHGTAGDRRNLTQRQWRDMVVGIYMAAADARYHEFRVALSRETRGSNFGLDAAVLALSAAGTVSGESTANTLAAITGALTGTRGALSKEVYFERTLPALVASMEAARTEVATRLHTGLGRSVADYPLERAFTDLLAYERAASLDQAIQRVTVGAALDAAQQQRAFQRIETVSSLVPAAERPLLERVTSNLTNWMNESGTDAEAAQRLERVLTQLEIPAGDPLPTRTMAAIDKVVELAAAGQLETFVAQLNSEHQVDLRQ